MSGHDDADDIEFAEPGDRRKQLQEQWPHYTDAEWAEYTALTLAWYGDEDKIRARVIDFLRYYHGEHGFNNLTAERIENAVADRVRSTEAAKAFHAAQPKPVPPTIRERVSNRWCSARWRLGQTVGSFIAGYNLADSE